MAISPTYKKTNNAVSSFSYSEIASGRVFKRLYLAILRETGDVGSGTLDYQLTENVTYSDQMLIRKTSGNAFDEDFDIEVLKPITIQGDGGVSFSVLDYNDSGSPVTRDAIFTATLRKWDGSTETDLASGARTISVNAEAAGGSKTFRISIPFNDITSTRFKRGEILRVNIMSDAVNGNSTFLAADPKNRGTYDGYSEVSSVDWSSVGTEAFADIPIRVI